jgi:hypothetical protein
MRGECSFEVPEGMIEFGRQNGDLLSFAGHDRNKYWGRDRRLNEEPEVAKSTFGLFVLHSGGV